MLETPKRRNPKGLALTDNQQGRFLKRKTLNDCTPIPN